MALLLPFHMVSGTGNVLLYASDSIESEIGATVKPDIVSRDEGEKDVTSVLSILLDI